MLRKLLGTVLPATALSTFASVAHAQIPAATELALQQIFDDAKQHKRYHCARMGIVERANRFHAARCSLFTEGTWATDSVRADFDPSDSLVILLGLVSHALRENLN